MEPGGIEPPTSCLQSSDEEDAKGTGTPANTGDSVDFGGSAD
jgi:hypothetical protein